MAVVAAIAVAAPTSGSVAMPSAGAGRAAAAWPGSAAVAAADDASVFGKNLSGLAYQPSGTGAPGILYAVRNGPSTLFRLIYDGTKWTPDTTNGWGAGKTLRYPDGTGVPDAEGVTLAGGDASGIFVSTERNDTAGNDNTSRPEVLRFDTTTAGATLDATKEFNLTADLPGLGANLGLEAVAWVPDSLLVAKGFVDEATSAAYDPATYADHGSGLFFVGVEQDGRVIAYALNQSTGAYTRIASIVSGFPKVMDLEYEPETTHLWAECDDNCNGQTATLDIAAATGHFAVTNTYDRPTGMANINNEGFAIAPQAECAGGLKPVFWSDDDNTSSHALRTGKLNCTDPAAPTATATASASPTATPTPTAGATATATATTTPAPTDATAPALKVSLKLAKAPRLRAKARVKVTLDETADLTLTLKAGKRAILRTTRTGVAAGARTITLKLKRKGAKGLHKGAKVKLTVVATDAAGNATTRRATAKLP